MTTAEWFFLQGTREVGPFTREQIQSLFAASSIRRETLVWRPGCADWTPLSAFEEFRLPREFQRPQMQQRAVSRDVDGYRETLDPEEAAEESAAPALAPAGQWVDESPHPWRRYVARMLDNVIWGALLLFIAVFVVSFLDPELGFEIGTWFEGRGGQIGGTVLLHLFAILPNALLVGLTGGNLGKWLCGICVLDETDRPIGLLRAVGREVRVFVVGLGLALPIISLITMILSHQTLKRDGATRWDKAMDLRIVHRKKGAAQYIGFAVAIILLVGLILSFFMLDRLLA
jgi:hypothetical protein